MQKYHYMVGQWVAAAICAGGIGIEVVMGADLGYVLITVGAVAFAVVTKFRRMRK